MKEYKGRVIKAVASKFLVDTLDGIKPCFARKKLKTDGNIFVGDYVKIEKQQKAFVIEEVIPRKNQLIRPYVSNVDMCLIVIASEPEPDYVLVDKVIVNCLSEDIEPVIIANKSDLDVLDLSAYKNIMKTIICSTETGEGLKDIEDVIKGKTVCFAGQSAVGKSSILNAILDETMMEVGELSKKISRGKNTTRHTELFKVEKLDAYLIDTCGFSMLETVDVSPENLRLYYDDFELHRKECKFNSCTHIDEPDCMVKKNIGIDIDEGRYLRYKLIYKELEDRRKNKYD